MRSTSVLMVLFFGLAVLAGGWFLFFSCDRVFLTFKRVYQGSGLSVYHDLSNLVSKNTDTLQRCRVADYRKSSDPAFDGRLAQYGLQKYTVSFSCDILRFTEDIYEREGNYYLLFADNGLCLGGDNTAFVENPGDNPPGGPFYVKHIFEYEAVSNRLSDPDFCRQFSERVSEDMSRLCPGVRE